MPDPSASDRSGTPPDALAAAPEEFERPSSARVYDYLLGGAAHGAVDRELGDRLKRSQPGVVELARENRAFLRRAVRFLLAAGIDQFLDLGSGVPTMGNVHEVIARSRSGRASPTPTSTPSPRSTASTCSPRCRPPPTPRST